MSMDISEQSVREHYGQLLGVGEQWEVEKVAIEHKSRRLEAWVQWRTGESLQCPECEKISPGYDRLSQRTWRHLDACGYTTLLHARVPRCNCPEHGVRAVRVPWAEPGSRFTLAFECYAIDVLEAARSVSDAAELLRVDWETVHRIRQRAVERGLASRSCEAVPYLGMDEKSFGRGHHYGTVLSDLGKGRVLEVVEHREESSVRQAIEALPEPLRRTIEAVAMDMWRPFIKASEELLPQADIVHDKFHVMGYLNEAVDKVRRQEHRTLKAQNDETLTGSKYLWLKNPCNLTAEQETSFAKLLEINLKAGRAWAHKEPFSAFWNCRSENEGRGFFKKWFGRAKRSKLGPLKAAADTIKRHVENIFTYFTHRITNAAAEGLNSLIQAIKSNARGFRNFAHYRIAILFHLGKLQLRPISTHSIP
jgi:transposase